eukprot:15276795-Alexandrium_andersonii.AAC.1
MLRTHVAPTWLEVANPRGSKGTVSVCMYACAPVSSVHIHPAAHDSTGNTHAMNTDSTPVC